MKSVKTYVESAHVFFQHEYDELLAKYRNRKDWPQVLITEDAGFTLIETVLGQAGVKPDIRYNLRVTKVLQPNGLLQKGYDRVAGLPFFALLEGPEPFPECLILVTRKQAEAALKRRRLDVPTLESLTYGRPVKVGPVHKITRINASAYHDYSGWPYRPEF